MNSEPQLVGFGKDWRLTDDDDDGLMRFKSLSFVYDTKRLAVTCGGEMTMVYFRSTCISFRMGPKRTNSSMVLWNPSSPPFLHVSDTHDMLQVKLKSAARERGSTQHQSPCGNGSNRLQACYKDTI